MKGVTRKKVIDICKANDIPIYEKNYSLYEALSAGEVFLTGTFSAQTPVAEIDGKKIGDGQGAGPMTLRIREFYKQLIEGMSKMRLVQSTIKTGEPKGSSFFFAHFWTDTSPNFS